MRFYSTKNQGLSVSLKEAVLQGLAPDKGLFMPERIPVLPENFLSRLSGMSMQEIALHVSKNLLGDDVDAQSLQAIVENAISFDAPLVEVEPNVYSLELFHGPTLAFKDFGARFMSQLLGHFARQEKREITILVATSGDTGSAVANGFLGVDGIRVVVLYPSGKVSRIQEMQFTTLGKNITALEVEGTFDDCQHMVKAAFMDAELREARYLTSANSINIARLIPQSFYYFRAYAQLEKLSHPVVFAVPSGNFGNLTAGMLAKRMGLPVGRFVAATNVNDVVPVYLKTKSFVPRPSVHTISNAMDVGNPSNFERMLDLYGNSFEALIGDLMGYAFTDEQTRDAIRDVYETTGYILDPHGAVGYLGLKSYMEMNDRVHGIFLETAHPAKFLDVVEEAAGTTVELPDRLKAFLQGTRQSIKIGNAYDDLRDFLMSGR